MLLGANFGLIWALEAAGLPALPDKILAEIILLAASFAVQQRYLFAGNAIGKAAPKAASGVGRGQ